MITQHSELFAHCSYSKAPAAGRAWFEFPLVLIGFAVFLMTGTSTAAPSGFTFTSIGILPGEDGSEVHALNNAVTVAGCSTYHYQQGANPYTRRSAARWTPAEGLKALPLLPYTPAAASGARDSFAGGTDVTADGTKLLFTSHTTPKDGLATATCSADGSNVVVLSSLPGGEKMQAGDQISDDGTTVFGYTPGPNFAVSAARWTAVDSFQTLLLPTGYTNASPAAQAISADGAVSAGVMWTRDADLNATAEQAYVWTANTGVEGIGYLPGHDRSSAWGMTADGSTILGTSRSSEAFSNGDFFLWRSGAGKTNLYGPAVNYQSGALISGAGISGDGSVIVMAWHEFFGFPGPVLSPFGYISYIINTEHRYYVEFTDAVRRVGAGDAIEGWSQFNIYGITDDGNTVFGFAQNSQGKSEGFIARFPAGFLRALAPPPAPQITSPATATTTVGELFVYQITGSNKPTLYSATNLPAGISFKSSTGVISGTPKAAESRQITLEATNDGGTGAQGLSLSVQAAQSIRIISGTSVAAIAGKPFSFQVRASGVSSAATTTATGLPAGLVVDGATGVISGTTTLTGSFGVTVTIQEGNASATETLEMIFVKAGGSPVITSPRTAILTPGKRFSYRMTVNPAAYPIYSQFEGQLPEGLTYDSSTRTISGIYMPSATVRASSIGSAISTAADSVIDSVVLLASNAEGSCAATLTFLKPLPELLNISTRVSILSGEKVLIGGFIVTGDAPKKVLLRGIGPSLAAQGVNGALADPILDLHLSDGSVVSNDNWKTAQQAEVEATRIPPTKDLESAIIQTLQPGAYTAVLSGKGGAEGVGLVEAYDLDAAADSKLANISTRGFVDTGDNVMIGGFIVGGGATKVLVRALGPSLQTEGINETLDDPQLELHDKNGATVASNDSWGDTQRTQIEATGIAPANDRECAILATLPVGNYTAIVRGASQTTGVSLVEVYDLNPNRR